MFKIDDVILSLIQFFVKISRPNRLFLGLAKEWRKERANKHQKDLFILLNGPSIRNQDLSLLKGRDIITVNQGFRLSSFTELSPKYHVFIDNKMIGGVWNLSWITEILDSAPKTKVVVPSHWSKF